jgi:hypothetical protein
VRGLRRIGTRSPNLLLTLATRPDRCAFPGYAERKLRRSLRLQPAEVETHGSSLNTSSASPGGLVTIGPGPQGGSGSCVVVGAPLELSLDLAQVAGQLRQFGAAEQDQEDEQDDQQIWTTGKRHGFDRTEPPPTLGERRRNSAEFAPRVSAPAASVRPIASSGHGSRPVTTTGRCRAPSTLGRVVEHPVGADCQSALAAVGSAHRGGRRCPTVWTRTFH